MRTIKFRGKDKETGAWRIGNLSLESTPYLLGDTVRINRIDRYTGIELFNEVDASTVGQWTGCVNDGGKEIYEGDIVNHGGSQYVVEWQGAGFVLVSNRRKAATGGIIPFDTRAALSYKVVGNIHDRGRRK